MFYEIPEHVEGVKKRYPNTKFPQAEIMVNPVITAVSQDTQNFNHGCLSVPSPNRCAVQSPMKMSVTYQNFMEKMRTKQATSNGVDAVVLWHELTHILDGKTYMDVTLESLPLDNLLLFKKRVQNELQNRQGDHHEHLPELTVPPFHFSVKINNAGFPRLDSKELADALPKMTDETLTGLYNQAHRLLKKNQYITDESRKAVPGLSIYSTKNGQNHLEAEPVSGLTKAKL